MQDQSNHHHATGATQTPIQIQHHQGSNQLQQEYRNRASTSHTTHMQSRATADQ
jgi:hypothetical protein